MDVRLILATHVEVDVVGDHRGDMVHGGKSQFVVLVPVVAVVVVEVQSI